MNTNSAQQEQLFRWMDCVPAGKVWGSHPCTPRHPAFLCSVCFLPQTTLMMGHNGGTQTCPLPTVNSHTQCREEHPALDLGLILPFTGAWTLFLTAESKLTPQSTRKKRKLSIGFWMGLKEPEVTGMK